MLKLINKLDLFFLIILFAIFYNNVLAKFYSEHKPSKIKNDQLSSLSFSSNKNLQRSRRIPRQAKFTDKSIKSFDQAAPLFQAMTNDLPAKDRV